MEQLEKVIAHYPEFTGVHTATDLLPQMSDEYKELCEDISKHGLLNEIARTPTGLLLDGRHRLLACYETNTRIRVKVIDPEDPVAWVVSQNLKRRNLTASQRALVAAGIRALYDNQARERQQVGRMNGAAVVNAARLQVKIPASAIEHSDTLVTPNKPPIGILARAESPHDESAVRLVAKIPPSGLKARDAAGAAVDVSGKYVDMACDVMKYAPELVKDVQQGTLNIVPAYRQVLEKRKLEQVIVAPGQRPALRVVAASAPPDEDEDEETPERVPKEPRHGGLGGKIMDKFADGGWHALDEIVAHVGVASEQVESALKGIVKRGGYGASAYCESKLIGKSCAYRLYREGAKRVDLDALMKELEPILKELEIEGRKNQAQHCPAAVAILTGRLRSTLEKFAK